MAERRKWELVNPEGISLVKAGKVNPHPTNLKGKTVVLRWNGKHNGDVFLNRIGQLLMEKIKDLKVIKSWEVEPDTKQVSENPDVSKRIAQRPAELNPDIAIGAQGD